MTKVLISIDDSLHSLKVVEHAINRYTRKEGMEIHLLYVRNPLSRHIARFISWRTRSAYHREQAEKSLAKARRMLERFGVPYAVHVELGADKSRTIHNAARRLGVDQILIGNAHKNTITRMVRDPVTNKVLDITDAPFQDVADGSVSRLRRYGIPAGIGTVLGLVYLAFD